MNVVSSTLSSFSRTPTPVSKSRATDEGVSNPAGYVTDISSPGDAGEDDSDTAFMYREATDLPRELKLRCQIHLEERTCKPCIKVALFQSYPTVPPVLSNVLFYFKMSLLSLFSTASSATVFPMHMGPSGPLLCPHPAT